MVILFSLCLYVINLTSLLAQSPEITNFQQYEIEYNSYESLSITIDTTSQFIYSTGNAGYKSFVSKHKTIDLSQVFFSRYISVSDVDGKIKTDSIIYDNENYIYVAGGVNGSFLNEVNNGAKDAFVLKSDTNENILLKTQFGTNSDDYIFSLAQDSITKDIYAVGTTNGNLFGLTNSGKRDAFIIKYDKNLIKKWEKLLGTIEDDYGTSITIDSQNKYIYVGGNTHGSFPNFSKSGHSDIFITKFDTVNGVLKWNVQMGTSGWDEINSILIDTNSNGEYIYVVGFFNASIDNIPYTGEHKGFLAKYSADGKIIWVTRIGIADSDIIRSITLNSDGKFIYVLGETTTDLVNQFLYKVFIAKYNNEGKQIWIKKDIQNIGRAKSITIDSNNENLYFCGYNPVSGSIVRNDAYILKMPAFICYPSCEKCTLDNSKDYCTSCKVNYFKKEDKNFPTECFLSSSPVQGYYFSMTTFKKCDISCLTCSSKDNCDSCADGYFTITGISFPTKCYLSSSPPQGYYFDSTTFKKCEIGCFTCLTKDSCTSCLSGYFKKEDKNFPTLCYSEKTYLEGYYFGGNSFKKCGNFCSLCSQTSCLSCIEGYLPIPGVDIQKECFQAGSPPIKR